MDDHTIENFPETYELAFVVGDNGNLVSYDNERWHAVVMRQESVPDFANTTQQFIHVYFRKAFGPETYRIKGIDVGEYQFLANGCRVQTPEDLAFNMLMKKMIEETVGMEHSIDDPKIVLAEDKFVNKALENRPPLWEPSDDQMEQVGFWITMFFEQEDEDDESDNW